MSDTPGETSIGGRDERFPETSWSLIRGAIRGRSGSAEPKLDELIRLYWKPVYATIRRSFSAPVEDAKDLTQEFFAKLLDGSFLGAADPERGSFRAFVKTAVKNYVRDRLRDASTQRRAPSKPSVSIDEEAVEGILRDHRSATPEELFDRAWARTVLDLAVTRLEAELRAEGKGIQADLFRAYYVDAPAGSPPTYRDLAARFQLRESDITNHLHGCRGRYRAAIEAIVRDTVATHTDVADEIKQLF